MMPKCNYRGCRKVSKIQVAKTWDKDSKDYHEPLYLCEKHAKKIAKKLCVELCGEKG